MEYKHSFCYSEELQLDGYRRVDTAYHDATMGGTEIIQFFQGEDSSHSCMAADTTLLQTKILGSPPLFSKPAPCNQIRHLMLLPYDTQFAILRDGAQVIENSTNENAVQIGQQIIAAGAGSATDCIDRRSADKI